MKLPDIATIVMAVIGVIGVLVAITTWFYKRGGQERAFTDALDRNTSANHEVATKLDDFKTVVLEMFHELDKRVTVVESKVK